MNYEIIISGISAILPTVNGVNNTIDDLISGTMFITPIDEDLKENMLEKIFSK